MVQYGVSLPTLTSSIGTNSVESIGTEWQKTSEIAKPPHVVSLAHLAARKLLSLSGEDVIYYQSLLNVSHWALIPH